MSHRAIAAIALVTLAAAPFNDLRAQSSQKIQTPIAPNDLKTWHGNFTGQSQDETLSLKGDDLYLTLGQSETVLVGSLRQFVTGKEGLHVFNLDNNPQNKLSLAFYDPTQDTWYQGSISEAHLLDWKPIANHLGRYTSLQVGSGATLLPLDQVEEAVASSSSIQAGASAALAPLNYPVEWIQYTALALSQHVWTHFVILADGTVLASTRVKENTWLGGFHTQARVAFYTTYSTVLQLTSVDSPSIGVTGTLWGHSDITVPWTGHVSPEDLPLIRFYPVVATWQPNWFTTIKDVSKFAEAAAKVIQPLSPLLGKGSGNQ